jgi:hypothetical protein
VHAGRGHGPAAALPSRRPDVVTTPKRNCTDLVSLLADFCEHHLPEDVHHELEQHLARCPRCVAQLKTYESTISLLRSIRDEDLPQELRCTLKAFIDKNCCN